MLSNSWVHMVECDFKSNHFLVVYEAVKTTINVAGVYGKGHLVVFFYVDRWVLREGGLDGYLGGQGLPVGIQECLERFHRRCVDYLSW